MIGHAYRGTPSGPSTTCATGTIIFDLTDQALLTVERPPDQGRKNDLLKFFELIFDLHDQALLTMDRPPDQGRLTRKARSV